MSSDWRENVIAAESAYSELFPNLRQNLGEDSLDDISSSHHIKGARLPQTNNSAKNSVQSNSNKNKYENKEDVDDDKLKPFKASEQNLALLEPPYVTNNSEAGDSHKRDNEGLSDMIAHTVKFPPPPRPTLPPALTLDDFDVTNILKKLPLPKSKLLASSAKDEERDGLLVESAASRLFRGSNIMAYDAEMKRKLQTERAKAQWQSTVEAVERTWSGLHDELVTFAVHVVDMRSCILAHGSLLCALRIPLSSHDSCTTVPGISDELATLRDEVLQCHRSVDDCYEQARRLEEMVMAKKGISDEEKSLHGRQMHAFQQVANRLLSESTVHREIIEMLGDVVDDLLSVPQGASCRLDYVDPNWSSIISLQSKLQASNRATNFVSYMHSFSLPVCRPVYEFLQNPYSHAYTLSICEYTFVHGEFRTILSYFSQNNNTTIPLSVHKLIIFNCGLNDHDTIHLADFLVSFSSLYYINLRNNRISSIGVSTFAKALWNGYCPRLQELLFDDNLIDTDGASSLARALTHCNHITSLSLGGNHLIGDMGFFYLLRHCMNRFRKARHTLPRPSSQDGNYDFPEPGGNGSVAGCDIRDSGPAFEADDMSLMDTDDEQEAMDDDSIIGGTAGGANGGGVDTFSLSGSSVYSDGYKFILDMRPDGGKRERGEKGVKGENDALKDDEDDPSSSPSERVSIFRKKSISTTADGGGGASEGRHDTLWVVLMLRVRAKLIAVSAFMRLRYRGLPITSINFRNCGLTSLAGRILTHALLDNINIVDIDISYNPKFGDNGCILLLPLLANSHTISSLHLDGCGISDVGCEILSVGAKACPSLLDLSLSDNIVGPTGSNWVASITNLFYPDTLSISSGFKGYAAPLTNDAVGVGSDKDDSSYGSDSEDIDLYEGFHDEDSFSGSEEGSILEE